MIELSTNTEKALEAKTNKEKMSRFSVFIISDKFFGIELPKVSEVITLPKLTKIPSSPKHILGVFSLRGTIFTLLEINEILGIPSKKPEEDSMVLVLDFPDQKIGIFVEKVLDVINVEESEIQLPSREMPTKLAKNIIGMYEKEGMGLIHLLKLTELLSVDKFL